jgi:hypothetical protein
MLSVFFIEKLPDLGLFDNPERIDWIFQSLRACAIALLGLFFILAFRRDGGQIKWRKYAIGALVLYIGISFAFISYACLSVYLGLQPDTSEQVHIRARLLLSFWLVELIFWWAFICLALGAGYIRHSLWTRKDTK